MTGEVTDRFNGITKKQSNDLQNLQSRTLILLGILLLTCFTSFSDWVECRSLGRRSTCNPTDWWPRIVDGCPIEFSCTNVDSVNKFVSKSQMSKFVFLHAKQHSIRATNLYQAVCTHKGYKIYDMSLMSQFSVNGTFLSTLLHGFMG